MPVALLLLVAMLRSFGADAAEPSPDRQKTIIDLVRNDCGACHGLNLKGGLGPPLLPETIKSRPDSGLIETIQEGHPGTPMPPWKSFLSRAETEWLVVRLKSGIPSPP